MFHLLDIARPLSFPLEADNEMVMQLLAALILTILIEYGVLWMLLERRKKVLLSSIAVNVLTNVPLNLYVMLVNDSMGDILIGEAVVFLVEAVWYWGFTRNLKQAGSGIPCGGSVVLGVHPQLEAGNHLQFPLQRHQFPHRIAPVVRLCSNFRN